MRNREKQENEKTGDRKNGEMKGLRKNVTGFVTGQAYSIYKDWIIVFLNKTEGEKYDRIYQKRNPLCAAGDSDYRTGSFLLRSVLELIVLMNSALENTDAKMIM